MRADTQLYCITKDYNPYVFKEGQDVKSRNFHNIEGGLPKDQAQANELRLFKEGQPIGIFTGDREIDGGTTFYKTKYISKGGFRQPTTNWIGGQGAGNYLDMEVYLWVSSQNVTDDLDGYYKKLDVIPEPEPPKVKPPVTDPTKPSVVADPKTPTVVADKSIFKQNDPNTGVQSPNYLLYGGIAFGIILVGVGLYWAFGSKPEPQPTPTIQYIPQPQPMK